MKQLIYVLTISALLVSCQTNTGTKSGANDMMAKNVAMANSYYEKVMNAHNADALDTMVAANYNEHTPDPGEGPGVAGLKKDIQGWLAAFPDQAFTINTIIADSNTVVALYNVTGTNTGTFMAMPATNKKINIGGMDMFKFDNTGKCTDHWGYFDQMKFMQQLGMMPSDSAMMAMHEKPMEKKGMKKK